MITIARGRNFRLVHSITDDGTTPSDMREDQGAGLAPIPVRCQLRESVAVRNPRSGQFELPLVCELNAVLEGDTGEYLVITLNALLTDKLAVGARYQIDAVGLWSDREEELLPVEPVEVINKPTKSIGIPLTQNEPVLAVPDFVTEFNEALTD